MQGLNFKSEYWLQFVEPFGDIHPSMQHSQTGSRGSRKSVFASLLRWEPNELDFRKISTLENDLDGGALKLKRVSSPPHSEGPAFHSAMKSFWVSNPASFAIANRESLVSCVMGTFRDSIQSDFRSGVPTMACW